MVSRSCWKSRHKNCDEAAPWWIRPGLVALLWLCIAQTGRGSAAMGETTNVVQKEAEFDVTYNGTVTSENQTIYAFNHTVSRNKVSLLTQIYLSFSVTACDDYIIFLFQTEGVRVSVLSQVSESPILFVVRQKQAVLSFQVPLILRGL